MARLASTNILENVSIDELEREIARRKDLNNIPKPRKNIDFTRLIGYVAESVDALGRGERVKDFEHYLFEEVINTIYDRESFWKWWNEHDGFGL